jgi:hypothetical protein
VQLSTTTLRFVVTPLALLFAGVGGQLWIAPAPAAKSFGLAAADAAGLVSLRADLGGLFVGLALLCWAGAWTQHRRPWLAAAAVILLAIAAGRTIGWLAGAGAGAGLVELGLELAGAAGLVAGARGAVPQRGSNATPTNRRGEGAMKVGITSIVTVACLLGTVAPAAAATVKYDYDRKVDFAAWEKAAWLRPEAPGGTLAEGRIRRALEEGFEAKGFTWVEAAPEADFLVACHAAARRDLRLEQSFRGAGFGRDLRLDTVPVGMLVVDVYDRRTGELAWRGMVSDALARDPEQADRKTAKAVAKLLANFPPRPRTREAQEP